DAKPSEPHEVPAIEPGRETLPQAPPNPSQPGHERHAVPSKQGTRNALSRRHSSNWKPGNTPRHVRFQDEPTIEPQFTMVLLASSHDASPTLRPVLDHRTLHRCVDAQHAFIKPL